MKNVQYPVKHITENTELCAEISYATCKEYAERLSEHIKQQLIPELKKHNIDPNTLFIDLQTRPLMSDTPNPYNNLMNVLKQFAGVARGGYEATIQLILAERKINKLNTDYK